MGQNDSKVVEHSATSGLLGRLEAALRADGVDPEHPTLEALAPYDHFHGGGLESTEAMAALVDVQPSDHLLDVGSGLGGPARWFATRYGCRVTGIDLSPEYCRIALHLTRRLGLDARVRFQVGDALALPFADHTFQGAYSMFVSMNILDRPTLYREMARVLEPGGWLVLSEIARGDTGEVAYPVPWAATAAESALATTDDTRRALQRAGFEIERVENGLERAMASAARSRAIVERGGEPPYRANLLVHGESATPMLANVARGYREGSLVPIEIVARRHRRPAATG